MKLKKLKRRKNLEKRNKDISNDVNKDPISLLPLLTKITIIVVFLTIICRTEVRAEQTTNEPIILNETNIQISPTESSSQDNLVIESIIDDDTTLGYNSSYYTNTIIPSLSFEEQVKMEAEAKEKELMEGFVYCEQVPLSEDLQKHLWKVCKEYGIKYCFALGTIQLESEFNPNATHYNRNGTIDRGLTQVNSCNIKKMKKLGFITCSDDLYEPYTSIRCGMYLLYEYVKDYGNTEHSYACYNTGNPKVHSNKNSRAVMNYWAAWSEILGDI